MITYANLLGGLLTSEFPYVIMIFCGYFFAKYGILKRDGVHTLSKLMIEIFIPVYLFINVCRSTSVGTIQNNYLIILSTLFYLLFAGGIALGYSILTKMDVRYRYTWIFMICITDIKLVHNLMVNTFCFHLSESSAISDKESLFCANSLKDNFVHMFFQGLVTWYVAFNLIRKDRINAEKVEMALEIAHRRRVDVIGDNKADNNETEGYNNKIREIIEKYDVAYSRATPEFMRDIEPLLLNKKINTKKWYSETLYVMLRPPLIGMFTGFVVGFIPSIQTWLFNTNTAVYLFFDTFNNIANSHIICGYLIIGANLYLNDQKDHKVKINKKDMCLQLVFKCMVLPFFGIIFSLISYQYIPDNRALIFTAFIQWIIPTSIDIIAIIQVKEINVKDACSLIFLQWILFVGISNFIHIPPFLSSISSSN